MAAHGGAVASDLVWTDGMPNWAPLFSVIPAPAPAAAPPPPPPPPQAAAPPPPAWQQPQQQQPQPSYQQQPQYQQPQYQQPQQQAPQYQMPMGMGNPGNVPGVAMAMNTGTNPPDMHWALVLVIGMFTGFFTLFWLYREVSFVKKIDPSSKAMQMFIMGFGGMIGYFVLALGMLAFDNNTMRAVFGLVGFVLMIGAFVCIVMGYFQMRDSIQRYYTTVEPIGLRLSGVMTFFFNIYYFQYHFSRIIKWKTTGVLDPQG